MSGLRLNDVMNSLCLEDSEDSERIIIALDFGTTYSGIAYAFSSKPDEVHCVEHWPGNPKSLPKTPTVLKYSSKKDFKWGYELDRSVTEKIVGIKLLLDPEQKRPLFDTAGATETKAQIAKLGKAPVDIATDYISTIYKHALSVIAGKVPKAYLDLLDKFFVLSVPAVWSDKAKDTTLRAARNAGIAPIELIKEPEAAAMYTLTYLKHQGLKVGDAIIICDAGGGTVDLVSYEIVCLHPLEVKELVTPSGGIAGSLMINKRFENWIRDMVGERLYIDLRETDAYRRAMKDFDENIKPEFRGVNDEPAFVNFPMANIPDNPARGIKGNTLTLQVRDMLDIFEPVFEEIDNLIRQQVNGVRIKRLADQHPEGAAIKAIFLVGGFGESQYLKSAIADSHPDIQVIQPNGAWCAIVKGAVLSKLPHQVSVVSSVAEHHYGVLTHSAWDEERDVGREKHWDRHDGLFRTNTLTWFINKHDDLQRDRTITYAFHRKFDKPMSESDYIVTDELKMCSSDYAPIHPSQAIQTNCKLLVNLKEIPKAQFKDKIGPAGPHLYLAFNLLVKIEGARMVFSFECGGKEYASVEADY